MEIKRREQGKPCWRMNHTSFYGYPERQEAGLRWELRGSHSQALAKKRQNQVSLSGPVHRALRLAI